MRARESAAEAEEDLGDHERDVEPDADGERAVEARGGVGVPGSVSVAVRVIAVRVPVVVDVRVSLCHAGY